MLTDASATALAHFLPVTEEKSSPELLACKSIVIQELFDEWDRYFLGLQVLFQKVVQQRFSQSAEVKHSSNIMAVWSFRRDGWRLRVICLLNQVNKDVDAWRE